MRLAISDFAILQLQRVEQLQRFGDRQVHAVGDGLALERDDEAFGPEPVAVAHRALTQGAIGIELLLHRPRAFFEAAAQVGDHAFEVAAERLGRDDFFLGAFPSSRN